jgi:hypothetical protein
VQKIITEKEDRLRTTKVHVLFKMRCLCKCLIPVLFFFLQTKHFFSRNFYLLIINLFKLNTIFYHPALARKEKHVTVGEPELVNQTSKHKQHKKVDPPRLYHPPCSYRLYCLRHHRPVQCILYFAKGSKNYYYNIWPFIVNTN